MSKVVYVIMSFAIGLINGILTPIDGLIYASLPALSDVINYANNLLLWLSQFILWVLSWLPFNSNIWSFFIGYVILKVTLSASISLIKIVVKWWHYLMP